MSERPQNFCYAPFVHMYVHSNEGERVCCMSTEDTIVDDNVDLDLRDRWTNQRSQNIRKQFLNNERPDICTKCFSLEDNGGVSDRNRFSDQYEELDIAVNVETGNQYNSPIDLDIRPGNLCNLACRMCGPVSSSQLQKEVKNIPIMRMIMGDGTIRESDVLKREENIRFILENADKGRRIKFLGGEPTIMPEVDRFLDILLEYGLIDTPIHFTTNCTNDNKRFIDKISKFTQVSFNYSVDGTGKVVEYIRHPVKFNSINKNIKSYHSIASYGEISYTLQAYNFFNITDSLEWAMGNNIYLRPELLIYPNELSCFSIPKRIRDKRIQVLIKMLDTVDSNGNNRQRMKDKVLPVLERIYESDIEYNIEQLAKHTKIIDTARNQHIKDYIPEIWEIIKDVY